MRFSGESRVASKEMAWERAWKWDWLGYFVLVVRGLGQGEGWEFWTSHQIQKREHHGFLTSFPRCREERVRLKSSSKNGVRRWRNCNSMILRFELGMTLIYLSMCNLVHIVLWSHTKYPSWKCTPLSIEGAVRDMGKPKHHCKSIYIRETGKFNLTW